jgi:hypothetical protein
LSTSDCVNCLNPSGVLTRRDAPVDCMTVPLSPGDGDRCDRRSRRDGGGAFMPVFNRARTSAVR